LIARLVTRAWDTIAARSARLLVSKTQALGYVIALLAVAAVSVAIAVVRRYASVDNISMLYLLAVLALAIFFGRGPAILASVAAFLTYDWFLTEPRYTMAVANPAEWIALLLFLVSAIVTSQLAADQRRQAVEAKRREREAVVLYDVARLMAEPDLDRALHEVSERVRQELQLAAVAVEVSDGAVVSAQALVGDEEGLELARSLALGPSRILGAGTAPTGGQRGAPGRWIRIVSATPPGQHDSLPRATRSRLHVVPVKALDRRVGSLLIVRAAGASPFSSVDDRLLSAVAAQLGLAVERVRLRQESTEAEILRRTDELKSALINAVSHDLRSPLASIIAGAQSLQRTDLPWPKEAREEFVATILSEGQRLNRIVLNLLDLSRIQAGSLHPQKSWYDLRSLVDDVLGRLRPMLAGHLVTIDIADDLPPVELDYVQIDEVLSNLVENAARYTPAGTRIEISARQSGSDVLVEVADNGPGVPEAALPRIFDAFYRAETPTARPKGTGLGLAVARGLVEAHGGRIWVENRPGGGARFAFTLPWGSPEQTSTPGRIRGDAA